MEEITLRPVTPQNWREAIALKVAPDQERFVESNVQSLAEAKIYPECVPMAIYAGETVVGFLMYGFSSADEHYWLIRLMIDTRWQGKGYGKAALKQVIELMQRLPGCEQIYLSYVPGNVVAEQLYASLGFCPTGEIMEGEEVACLELREQG